MRGCTCGEPVAGADRGSAAHEEPDCRGPLDGGQGLIARRRDLERAELHALCGGQRHPGSRRDDEPRQRCIAQPAGEELGEGGAREVSVIEHDEDLPATRDGPPDPFGGACCGRRRGAENPHGSSDLATRRIGPCDREERAVHRGTRLGESAHERGLADAWGARHRHDAVLGDRA